MEEARQTEAAWEVRLGIPELELDKLSLASAKPRRLRAWLDALPMGDPHRSAPLLLTLLEELPRLRIDDRRRLALLEQVRPRVRQMAYTLESRYLNLPLMPPERALQAAALTHRLFQGLALGYQSVATPLLRGKLNLPGRQAAATALQRAMDARSQDLFLHMLLYKSPPAGTWRVLHSLYAEAERHALEALTVSDPELPGQEGAVSIAYGRLLLTASAQPNQLRQPALMALYRAAAHWARWMPLLAEAADAPFHVDLQGDAGPQPVSVPADGGETLRYFDTRPLAAALAEGGASQRSRPLSDILSRHATRRTVKCCSVWAWTRCTGALIRAKTMSPCTGCGALITAMAVIVWNGVAARPTPCAPGGCWPCLRRSAHTGGWAKYAGWPGSAIRCVWACRCCPKPCGRCGSAPAGRMPGRRRRCWYRPRKATTRKPWWCPPPVTAVARG
jgi:hypothetical protein